MKYTDEELWTPLQHLYERDETNRNHGFKNLTTGICGNEHDELKIFRAAKEKVYLNGVENPRTVLDIIYDGTCSPFLVDCKTCLELCMNERVEQFADIILHHESSWCFKSIFWWIFCEYFQQEKFNREQEVQKNLMNGIGLHYTALTVILDKKLSKIQNKDRRIALRKLFFGYFSYVLSESCYVALIRYFPGSLWIHSPLVRNRVSDDINQIITSTKTSYISRNLNRSRLYPKGIVIPPPFAKDKEQQSEAETQADDSPEIIETEERLMKRRKKIPLFIWLEDRRLNQDERMILAEQDVSLPATELFDTQKVSSLTRSFLGYSTENQPGKKANINHVVVSPMKRYGGSDTYRPFLTEEMEKIRLENSKKFESLMKRKKVSRK